MSLFEYKGEDALGLVTDAMSLVMFEYYVAEDGRTIEKDSVPTGWELLTADEIGYEDANLGSDGWFNGEKSAFEDAQAAVLAQYDDEGNITQVGLVFAGTNDAGDILDYLEFFEDNPDYAEDAFGNLLSSVKDLLLDNGLDASDLIVAGHSLGGGAVTNMAEKSDRFEDGFFVNANYIGVAAHYAPEDGSSVLSSGAEILSFDFENDPVPSALSEDGVDITGNDKNYEYDTSNIIMFNDYYDTPIYWNGPDLLNLLTWDVHSRTVYEKAFEAISTSEFYDEMERDSLIIISDLSKDEREDTWVEDIDLALDNTGHYGDDAYILGSQHDDLLRGNDGDDTLEGFAGNDFLKGGHGADRLLGGEGDDTLRGGKGKDTLYDGAGSDDLRGGNGDDVFSFIDDGTLDTIEDFELGADLIDLSAAGVTSFDSLTITQDGSSDPVVIAYGDDTLHVEGDSLNASDFGSSNFMFA
ncbi:calcium-binding protein [Flexibacterium corallicola]|uniref:calcium-binding protein n=1 Tax=Flexibacterium corallicola TaxID=3037259 RepID=UPI00286ECA6A|nr:triacylglycerol lipase [Pseudovibrio sp. M1P-2-3]